MDPLRPFLSLVRSLWTSQPIDDLAAQPNRAVGIDDRHANADVDRTLLSQER